MKEAKMNYPPTEQGTKLYFSKLAALSDEYFHMLTPWQRKFVTSVFGSFVVNSALSKNQMDQVDNIFWQIAERV
jgi:hypothetical protein